MIMTKYLCKNDGYSQRIQLHNSFTPKFSNFIKDLTNKKNHFISTCNHSTMGLLSFIILTDLLTIFYIFFTALFNYKVSMRWSICKFLLPRVHWHLQSFLTHRCRFVVVSNHLLVHIRASIPKALEGSIT